MITYAGPAADARWRRSRWAWRPTLMPGLIDMHVHLTFSSTNDVVNDYLNDSGFHAAGSWALIQCAPRTHGGCHDRARMWWAQ